MAKKKQPAGGKLSVDKPPFVAFEKLSEPTKILINQMLDRRYGTTSISRAVTNMSEERITPEQVARHAKTYIAATKRRQLAREITNNFVWELLSRGGKISDTLRSGFHECIAFARKTGVLKEMDPLSFEAAERHRQELMLRGTQALLADRRAKISEDRWKLDRKKATAALAKLERKTRAGRSVTPEEMHRIREIYGLSEPPQPNGHSQDRKAPQFERDHTHGKSEQVNRASAPRA